MFPKVRYYCYYSCCHKINHNNNKQTNKQTNTHTHTHTHTQQRFFLLRGNHECRQVTSMYNFKKECVWKYGSSLYDDVMVAFDSLSLAALVTNQMDEVGLFDCFVCLFVVVVVCCCF
jgi:hypothetical protein